MTDDTSLTIDGILIPVGAARGVKAALELVDNGQLRRTVNGELVDLTRTTSRKYKLSLSCSDLSTPTLADLVRGQAVTVVPPKRLRQAVPYSGTVTLRRPAAEGTLRAQDQSGAAVACTLDGDVVSAPAGSIVSYLPVLDMLVASVSHDAEEWDATESWSIELEEV